MTTDSRLITITPIKQSGLPTQIAIPVALQELEDGCDRGSSCVFRILTVEDGDKRIVWNANRLIEIRDAAKLFNDCVAAGMVPYRIGKDGKPAGTMNEFDPTAEEVLFAPLSLAAAG